jgi:acyl-CoA synthetase (AMP-forming)/AMP-acid ligase II
MRGYWNLPEASAEALRDGWMHSDAAVMDDEGFVYIQDRVKDMIVSGGENVYPREIEDVLFRHPAVADAAVIGVPDAQWGEVVKAIVVLRPGASATEPELVEFCRGQLASYKRPRSVDFIAELPRNPSGKVLKKDLREPFWKGHSRREGLTAPLSRRSRSRARATVRRPPGRRPAPRASDPSAGAARANPREARRAASQSRGC